MTSVDAIERALREWLETMDPEAKVAVMLTVEEIAVLHLWLGLIQDGLESRGLPESDLSVFGRVRGKVESLLSQAGYGGDPRP